VTNTDPTAAAPMSKLAAADFINRSQQEMPRFYGEALVAAARRDSRIVCLSADLTAPTETDLFRDTFPDRFHNTGIAEANMLGVAGGLARGGEIPFAHSFCCFVTKRCYDQISMQAAYPNLPVKVVGFLPGLSTLLGVSHQALEDVAIMRALPNMTVVEPSGPEYFAAAVEVALAHDGPVYLRMKRPESPPAAAVESQPLQLGRGILRRAGEDLTIIAAGLSVAEADAAADELAHDGVAASVVDMASLKPLDAALVLERAAATGAVVTAENHSIIGGLGAAVAEVLCEAGVGVPFKRVGVRDCFAEGGSTAYLFAKYRIDRAAIAAAARDVLRRKKSI